VTTVCCCVSVIARIILNYLINTFDECGSYGWYCGEVFLINGTVYWLRSSVAVQSSVSLRANDGTSRSIASSIEEINVKRTAITLNALSGDTYIDPLITGICWTNRTYSEINSYLDVSPPPLSLSLSLSLSLWQISFKLQSTRTPRNSLLTWTSI